MKILCLIYIIVLVIAEILITIYLKKLFKDNKMIKQLISLMVCGIIILLLSLSTAILIYVQAFDWVYIVVGAIIIVVIFSVRITRDIYNDNYRRG